MDVLETLTADRTAEVWRVLDRVADPELDEPITAMGFVETVRVEARTATVVCVPAVACTLTYNGSPPAPTNAGSYTVVAAVTDPNYHGGATGTLAVAKGEALVLFDSLGATYDGSGKAVPVSSEPITGRPCARASACST